MKQSLRGFLSRRFRNRVVIAAGIALLLLAAQGCYHVRVGTSITEAHRHTITAPSYFWGLVRPRETVGDSTLNAVKLVGYERNFGQTLVSLLTLGIYVPTTAYVDLESCPPKTDPPPEIVPIDIRRVNADYPVPLPAALGALHSDGGPLFLEPSSVRSATVAARDVWGGGAHHLSVGAEFAPILIGDGVDLPEYLDSRLHRILYRTRISFAVETGIGGGFRSAIGLRWMLHDDADLRADSLFAETVTSWPVEKRTMLDSLRDALKERFWNRSVFELAIAAKYRSTPDADGAMIFAVRQYHGFFSTGFPMLGRGGQVQLGGSGWAGFADDDPRYQRQGALTFRTFYGSASERLFAGVRLIATNLLEPDYRMELGGLLRIGNGIWLRPDFGVSLSRRPSRGAEASVTISFGTPEIVDR